MVVDTELLKILSGDALQKNERKVDHRPKCKMPNF